MPRWMRKALAYTPAMVVSFSMFYLAVFFMPVSVRVWVFYVGVGLFPLAWWFGEVPTARVMYLARPINQREIALVAPALTMLCRAGLGPPVVSVWVQPFTHRLHVEPLGRRIVLVPGTLFDALFDRKVTQEQVAYLIGHAAGMVRGGWTRHDPALSYATIPWQVLAGIVEGIARAGRTYPLATLAWRARFVTLTLGALLIVKDEGDWGLAALITAAGAVSYLVPFWQRSWGKAMTYAGDQAVAQAGLSQVILAALRTLPQDRFTRSRIERLLPPPAAPASLAVVDGTS